MAQLTRKEARLRRHRRVRGKISGTAERPRMSVCVTRKHIYVQFIDDDRGHTLASASSLDPEIRQANHRVTVEDAVKVGRLAAQRALEKNITEVVFDRGGFKYHGKVKAVAESAREAGLKF